MDFYHENYLYDWMVSTVMGLKLQRADCKCILSLQYFAGVSVKKKSIHSLSSFAKFCEFKPKSSFKFRYSRFLFLTTKKSSFAAIEITPPK